MNFYQLHSIFIIFICSTVFFPGPTNASLPSQDIFLSYPFCVVFRVGPMQLLEIAGEIG